MSRFRALLVLFSVVGSLGGAVDAQEKNPFYERDFARNPLAPEPSPYDLRRPQTPSPAGERTPPETDRAQDGADTPAQAAPSAAAVVGDAREGGVDLTALEKTHKVLAVGGVINAVNKAHFDEKLKELLEVVERYDLDVGLIWAIGSVQNLMSSQEALYLVARQGVLEAAEEAPAHYKIKMSPTWVLRTPEGEILLEATGPLAAHFNLKGEFVEKQSEMRVARDVAAPALKSVEGGETPPAATPTPSPTPDALFGGAQPKM